MYNLTFFSVLLSYKLLSRGIMVQLWFLAAMLHMVSLRLKFKFLILILYIYGYPSYSVMCSLKSVCPLPPDQPDEHYYENYSLVCQERSCGENSVNSLGLSKDTALNCCIYSCTLQLNYHYSNDILIKKRSVSLVAPEQLSVCNSNKSHVSSIKAVQQLTLILSFEKLTEILIFSTNGKATLPQYFTEVWTFKGEGRDTSWDIYATFSVRFSRKTFFF